MNNDRLQHQYREAVDELDRRERRWQATEELLRRLASRVCIAARGQHAGLDEALNQLIAALRRPAEAEQLEPILAQLTQAITALDALPPAAAKVAATPTPAASGTTARLGQALAQLLDRVAAEGEAPAELQDLRRALPALTDAEALGTAALKAARGLEAQLERLRGERGEAQRLLQELSGRLEEISLHLRGEDAERAAADADGSAFGQTLLSHTEALRDKVREATDLASLQQQVHQRLSAIGAHVRDYRGREEARLEAYRLRTEQLHSRVEELENRTLLLTRSLANSEQRAYTDALTGVPNRQAYDERIARSFEQWPSDRRPRSLAAFDIDHFKRINDQHGHLVGDKVLQLLAQHLSRHLREADFFARYGGEEFVLLMDGLPLAQALTVTDRLRQGVEKLSFHCQNTPVQITVSCGVASLCEGDTAESLFGRADQALYAAKHGGRNRCVAG